MTILNRQSGQQFQLCGKRGPVSLGSSKKSDIVIQDAYASGTHCSLQPTSTGVWVLRDHDSKNGTHINGIRVQLAEVCPGSQISIGHTCFELLAECAPSHEAKDRLLGESPIFLSAIDKALRAARSNCSILILGETGTGKELVAKAIHEASRRCRKPFVAINCGGIPKELIRSELFGHVKGAFTGATETRDGLFSQAQGGTVFLDELGELPRDQQPNLLRALESGLIRRVGGGSEELVNVRFVAATNRNCLFQRTSPLRADLFHRLSTVIVELPPLRDRKDDIPRLVRSFLSSGVAEFGVREVETQTLQQLSEHEWKGNVRELRNSVTRALALGRGVLQLTDFLPNGIVSRVPEGSNTGAQSPICSLSMYQHSQRKLLVDAYQQEGSIRAAAQYIGMPKSTFADLCRRYHINTRFKKQRRNSQ